MDYAYGSSLYPTEHARDLAAAIDWLTASGANPVASLPTTPDEARTAAEEYRADVANRQWDDSNLGWTNRNVDELAGLFLEAAEAARLSDMLPEAASKIGSYQTHTATETPRRDVNPTKHIARDASSALCGAAISLHERNANPFEANCEACCREHARRYGHNTDPKKASTSP